MSWGPNWSLIGKCVSVDNRSNLPDIIIPQEAQGRFKLLRAWVGVLCCVVCVCQLLTAKGQSSDGGDC